MNQPILQLKNFGFAFNKAMVLKDLSFSLNCGDYLSIIGPNGAGKSTLLKSLLRLHEHGRATGEILIQGQPLTKFQQPELARIISYVPQAGGWIPPFSVEEFLRLSRYPHTTRVNGLVKPAPQANNSRPKLTNDQAVARAIELTGLESLSQRSLRNLSGGERQKAYLAAALAQDTEIMLLDEPAAFLDPKHAADLNKLLKNLNQEHGLTMLTVTHDLNHPLQAGGKALVLKPPNRLEPRAQLYFGPVQGLLPVPPATTGILEQAFNHSFSYFEHPHNHRPAVLPD